MKTRESFKVIVDPIAQGRIDKNQCPSCGKPKEQWNRRKDWRCCSTECTQKWIKEYVTIGWNDLREQVFKRDNYTCVKCGYAPTKQKWCMKYDEKGNPIIKDPTRIHYEDLYAGDIKDVPNTSMLIADHIIPIAVGGEQWDINNIQTLCVECNKIKTRKDQGDIAKERKREKMNLLGQKTLM